MRAIVLPGYGKPEVLRFEEVTTPKPGPGEVLIRVHNVSVNVTLDIILRKGNYPMKPPLPHVMGIDPVGEIAAVGSGVTNHAPGDRVGVHTLMPSESCIPGHEADDPGPFRVIGIHRWGGYAEYVTVPEENAFAIPDDLAYPEATVIVRHLPTARHLLRSKAKLKEAEWVLVMGATGGLASCCVQVAKRMGATVIAAAGAEEAVAEEEAFWAQGAAEIAKKRAAAMLQEGGIFAFGLSEKNHGADIYSTDMILKKQDDGTYLANGSKYYIGYFYVLNA